MSSRDASEGAAGNALRHYGGFILAGTVAYLVDAGVLQGLITFTRLGPFTARLWAIGAAMLAAWLINRTVTFPVAGPPTLGELLRYATLGWVGAALNYAIYAGILLARPSTEPVLALTAASAIGMLYSYLGMRFAVFRRP